MNLRLVAGIFFLTIALVANVSCKKDSEYLPVPYTCKCGNMNWYNTSYNLLSAGTILMDSTETTSRRYLITADISGKDSPTQESVNIQLDVPDVLLTPLELNDEATEFGGDVQKVLLVNNVDLTYRYRVISGTISVSPALNGGTEYVSFSLLLDPLFGSAEDPAVPVSGSFSVNVQL